MKKALILLTLLLTAGWAEVINEPASKELMEKKIPVIDIRTPGEWKETGLLKGSIPIVFFDANGGYNVERFMKELNARIDTKKPYALICLTGTRTSMLAPYLSETYGHTVYNLEGGIVNAYRSGLPIEPYKE